MIGKSLITGGSGAAGSQRIRLRRRVMRPFWLLLLAWWLLGQPAAGLGAVLVIGHEGLAAMDTTTVSRIYTGRTVQIAGVAVQPVNLKAGNPVRAAFLRGVLQQSDDDYVAYWIVRRAIGKGVPPPEMDASEGVIDFVRATPGAIGYVDGTSAPAGVAILLKLP